MNEYRVTIALSKEGFRGRQLHPFRVHAATEGDARIEGYVLAENVYTWRDMDLRVDIESVELLVEDIAAMQERARARALRNRAIAREAR